MSSARIKKARFTQKGKWFKGNWNFQYKPRTEDGNKANLQDLEQIQGNLTQF